METKPHITLIGSGRLATQLGVRLSDVGLPVAQVVSRSAEHARTLAEKLGCAWSDQVSAVDPKTAWVILAVSDTAIGGVAQQLAEVAPHALVTHTSGATPGAVLGMRFRRYGVLYPLQTFSADRPVAWSGLPICVDANDDSATQMLMEVAMQLGGIPRQLNDEQRAWVHLSAVFANNFANHCFAIAESLLQERALPFELLHPLMRETVERALTQSPGAAQTGPAVRNDRGTQEAHLVLLSDDARRSDIYRLMSADIAADAEGRV
jgi:predicted short-subunit dehydrogenase-like oxidoreductase (DUF2520 family)